MRKYLLIGFLVILGGFFINSGPFFSKKLSTSAFLNDALNIDFKSDEELKARIEKLEKENEALRLSLLEQENDAVMDIKVYSSYPFNSRGEIAIAGGEDVEIKAGDTVVYAGNILIGQVRDVFGNSSIVTTIFDPSWQMAVRVGNGEADALMRGGNQLTLSLIPQDAFIEIGDIVVSADRNFPYGLELGTVKEIQNAQGDVFKEAIVEPTLNIKNLKNVTVYH